MEEKHIAAELRWIKRGFVSLSFYTMLIAI